MNSIVRILVIFMFAGCGLNEKEWSNGVSSDSKPCHIRFDYRITKKLGDIGDWITYRPGHTSEACTEYVGENVQALSYSIRIQARPSPAILELFALDSNRTLVFRDGETMGKGDLSLTNLRQEDWVGPLDRLEDMQIGFLLPEGSERSLYPHMVELTIAPR